MMKGPGSFRVARGHQAVDQIKEHSRNSSEMDNPLDQTFVKNAHTNLNALAEESEFLPIEESVRVPQIKHSIKKGRRLET